MGQAAKQSGSNLEELAYQFEKIDAAREHYLAGGEKAQEFGRAFGALGINKSMLTSQTAAQLFMGPMSNVAKNRSPEELGAIFRELGIRQFGPMIATLKTDFNSLGKKMRETGLIMDTDTAVKLKILSQELSVSQLIGVMLGPAIVSLLQKILWIVGMVASVGAYLKALVTSINWKVGALPRLDFQLMVKLHTQVVSHRLFKHTLLATNPLKLGDQSSSASW